MSNLLANANEKAPTKASPAPVVSIALTESAFIIFTELFFM